MRKPAEIVIAGGGTAGWMAAATFARFLGDACSITLVESDAIGTVGVGEATIPQIHNLLVGLGLDQAEFVRETNASFKLGIEFVGWRDPAHSYIHSFGSTGRGVGLIPFRQLWLRGRALGQVEDFGAYSANVQAARSGGFSLSQANDRAEPLPYAYHFDASLLAKLLRRYAEERGVTRVEGKIEEVVRNGETGDINALRISDERTVPGDLFIDCTGFVSLLLGKSLAVEFDDWSHWLPCDSALAVPCENGATLRPYTQSIARPAGWQWRIPLQSRTGNGHVFCSAFMGQDDAADLLLANLEGKALGDPRPIRFTTGHRRQPWAHNCVALGLSAGFMEPLESTSIHLVQSGLGRLLNLLPNDFSDLATPRAMFNRLTNVEWQQIRDFLVLHYVANGRHGEPFWDHCRAMAIPDSLAEKIALFRQSGLVMREADDLFLDDSWGQVMLGQGIEPSGWSPLADNVPGEDIGPFLGSIAKSARVKAQALPPHGAFIKAMLGTTSETTS
ncbi:tryptophan 7-halogenase [Sphingomonas sp. KRR8]|uniref:tryptophan halogenase family protein n=1 Tax=Sphingomonas sp. KRR8 TaxID=2942996 RepID=UPI002021B1DC|nr:tryptophan halogenase family protein [Sphingomonas sp. KRR8]URD60939.1 tryptophan 7-halogenase [Sphingomonas sp. KRR8]URD60947.1 tryptophan 7-halogenase [Sphingomonas sp. KRR8]